MLTQYCWRFGDHKGDPCPCGYSEATDPLVVYANEVSRLRDALDRERTGARRAAIEARKQMKDDWARHFDRMEARIDKVMEAKP